MLHTKEISYQKDVIDIEWYGSLRSLAGRGLQSLHYLLSPEDSSAPPVPCQDKDQKHSPLATAKVLFWFTVAITVTTLLGNLA